MEKVTIMDVTLRDGLQNEDFLLDLDEKAYLLEELRSCGFSRIEAGAFVNPGAVPQMANTGEFFRQKVQHTEGIFSLIPNQKGYELAKAAGAKNVAFVMAVTETMNKKNVRMSVQESYEAFLSIFEQAKADGIGMRLYLAVVFHCPFEGRTSEQLATEWIKKLAGLELEDLCLADTDGKAEPAQVSRILEGCIGDFKNSKTSLSLHLHNTYNLAEQNARIALKAGVRRFDSAVAGLGGCPFAPGAKGNISTENLVSICKEEGFETSIDEERLGKLSQWLGKIKNTRLAERSTKL